MTDFSETMGQLFGSLFAVLMIVLPAIVLYLIIRRAVSGGVRDATERSVERYDRTPRDILDERYARGEIGRDEYERVRRDFETG
jgi:putative membrane protein